MCNFYSITTNQAAMIALFRVINRYVGNLPPMPGVFPDYPAPVIHASEGAFARWPWCAGAYRSLCRRDVSQTRDPSAARHALRFWESPDVRLYVNGPT